MARKGTKRTADNVKRSSAVKTLLSADEISKGISSLKNVATWSAEGALPTYSDESATIYLQFASNNIKRTDPIGRVILPNPLSYNRSVCVIASRMDVDPEVAVKLNALLEEISIKGKITIKPSEEVKASLAARNLEDMYNLAKEFDTYLAEKKVLSEISVRALTVQMSKQGKHINLLMPMGSKEMKETLKEGLAKSFIVANATKDAYLWKVAHTGMTDAQIAENVTAALDALSTWTTSFPSGLQHFNSVTLKTGDSDGVAIFTNDGEVLEEQDYYRHQNQELFVKADDQLYWMNRMQEKDGNAYWKVGDKKLRNIIKDAAQAKKLLKSRNNPAAGRVERIRAIKKNRNSKRTPGSRKKSRKSVGELAAAATPVKAEEPVDAAASPAKKAKMQTPKPQTPAGVNTPGSGKKAKKSPFKPQTPNPQTPKPQTPGQVNTPGSGKKSKKSPFKPQTPNPQTPGQVNAPGSGKKSKSPFKPQTPNPQTPVQAATPGSGKKQKGNTPQLQKALTPGSTPLKENTPASTKPATPGSAAPNGTPGSAGKKKRSRKSRLAGTPAGTPGRAFATPGSDGKKSPGMKTRLRIRASIGVKN